MPKSMVSSGEFILPEENTLYPARLAAVRIETIRPRDPSKKAFDKWRWEFEFLGGSVGGQSLVGQKVTGDTWPRITTADDDLARDWAGTLSGRELEMGEDFDTDTVVGERCQITVRHDRTMG